MGQIEFNQTKYESGCQCPKKLWIDLYGDADLKEKFETNNLIEEGKRTKEVAKKMFKKYVTAQVPEIFEAGIGGCDIATMNFLLDDEVKVIYDALFEYKYCYARCDIIKKNRNQLELYYVKASTTVEPRFIDEMAYQYYIISSLGYKIKKAVLISINDEYVRGNKLSLKELFVETDFTDVVAFNSKNVEEQIEIYRNVLEKDEEEPEMDLGMHCFLPFECPYFEHCKKCHNVPEMSIFEIPRQRKTTSVKFYKDGITTLKQALEIELSKPVEKQNVGKIVFLRQETGDKVKDYICRSDLAVFLDSLYYPLYFLDFETFSQAVPSFKGQKPYEQVPFQYSLHYIPKKGGPVHHKEFLAQEGIDPRKDLAKQLCEDIPEDACVLAYNMSFEKNVILRLSEQFGEYADKLLTIHEHIDDLMIPFAKRWYYSYDMHGSYSIKKVLPALFPDDPQLNYANLNTVHKGDEAMLEFKRLSEYDPIKRLEVREALLRYCELDTFAMVRIYFELERVVAEEIEPSEEKKAKMASKEAKRKKRKIKVITNEDVIQDNPQS